MDLEPVRLDGIDGIAASFGSIAPHLTRRAANPVHPVHRINDRAPQTKRSSSIRRSRRRRASSRAAPPSPRPWNGSTKS